MNIRDITELVEVIYSKIFLRSLILLAGLILISSYFPWTKAVYDRVFPQPELRIFQEAPLRDARLGNETWYQRIVVVENRGNSPADQVYISASAPSGRITRYEVFSNYPYAVHPDTDTSKGYLLLEVDQLAPGAKIVVYCWATQAIYSGSTDISFAAVHDTGSAPPPTMPSSELSSAEQIRYMVDRALVNFKESHDAVIARTNIGEPVIDYQDQMFRILLPTNITPYLAITAIGLALLAWLFLDSVKAALVHGGLVSGMFWLLVPNFFLPPTILIWSTVPVFVLLALREGLFNLIGRALSLLRTSREEVVRAEVFVFDKKSRSMFLLSVLVLVFGLFLSRDILPWGMPPAMDLTVGYLMVGYIVTVLSLALL